MPAGSDAFGCHPLLRVVTGGLYDYLGSPHTSYVLVRLRISRWDFVSPLALGYMLRTLRPSCMTLGLRCCLSAGLEVSFLSLVVHCRVVVFLWVARLQWFLVRCIQACYLSYSFLPIVPGVS